MRSISGEGCCDYSFDILNRLSKIYYVEDFETIQTEDLVKKIERLNLHAEMILNPIDPKKVEGLILPYQQIGIVTKDFMCSNADNHSQLLYVQTRMEKVPNIIKKELDILLNQISQKELQIIEKFQEARNYYKEIKTIYENALYEESYNVIYQHILDEMEKWEIQSDIHEEKNIYADDIFIGAITYSGPYHLMQQFMNKVRRKIILKGNIGQKKSELLYGLSRWCQENGSRVIQCHCPFEPSELDAVIIPKFDVMVVDGDKPHEIEVSHPLDRLIDLTSCVDQFKLLKESYSMKECTAKYKQHMRQGTLLLQEYRKMKQHLSFILYQHMPHEDDPDLNLHHFLSHDLSS